MILNLVITTPATRNRLATSGAPENRIEPRHLRAPRISLPPEHPRGKQTAANTPGWGADCCSTLDSRVGQDVNPRYRSPVVRGAGSPSASTGGLPVGGTGSSHPPQPPIQTGSFPTPQSIRIASASPTCQHGMTVVADCRPILLCGNRAHSSGTSHSGQGKSQEQEPDFPFLPMFISPDRSGATKAVAIRIEIDTGPRTSFQHASLTICNRVLKRVVFDFFRIGID